jgi:hypothetical protein
MDGKTDYSLFYLLSTYLLQTYPLYYLLSTYLLQKYPLFYLLSTYLLENISNIYSHTISFRLSLILDDSLINAFLLLSTKLQKLQSTTTITAISIKKIISGTIPIIVMKFADLKYERMTDLLSFVALN